MIKIVIKIDESSQKITSIEVKGHSNKAAYGKDLVCAAVSAIITGGMNALNKNDFDLILDEGYSLIESNNIPNDNDAIVLKTIQIQLQTVSEAEPKFVKIEIL